MDKYVIINKVIIEEIIEELKKEIPITLDKRRDFSNYAMLNVLRGILENSIPLNPEIEKAFNTGMAHAAASYKELQQIHPDKQEYISNLKLDI